MTDVPGPELARSIREASASWRAARAAGTAREPDRPRVLFPGPSVGERAVGDLVMAICDSMAFLDDEGFGIAQIHSDRNEDRVVWVGPGERFIEVGLSSGPIVMIGRTIDGAVPPYSPDAYSHARDVVPDPAAAELPDMELPPGETDIRVTLPACAAWARAALGAVPPLT